MENFEQLKDVIFDKLKDEMKEVSNFHLSGKFGDYQDQAVKYNELYYTFNYGIWECSDVDLKVSKYGYTVEDIKNLMVKISTGLADGDYDASFLNKILKRRKSGLSFEDIFDLKKLEQKTHELQVKYNNLSWLKKLWLKLC